MFVNHAPLYYDTNGRLPDSYKELGLLIQQLTQLSSDIAVGDTAHGTEALDVIEVLYLVHLFLRSILKAN